MYRPSSMALGVGHKVVGSKSRFWHCARLACCTYFMLTLCIFLHTPSIPIDAILLTVSLSSLSSSFLTPKPLLLNPRNLLTADIVTSLSHQLRSIHQFHWWPAGVCNNFLGLCIQLPFTILGGIVLYRHCRQRWAISVRLRIVNDRGASTSRPTCTRSS